jgi:hypothetical protein
VENSHWKEWTCKSVRDDYEYDYDDDDDDDDDDDKAVLAECFVVSPQF